MWRWWRHCDAVYWTELVLLCFPTLDIPFSNQKLQKAPGTYCYLSNISYFLGVFMGKMGLFFLITHTDFSWQLWPTVTPKKLWKLIYCSSHTILWLLKAKSASLTQLLQRISNVYLTLENLLSPIRSLHQIINFTIYFN